MNRPRRVTPRGWRVFSTCDALRANLLHGTTIRARLQSARIFGRPRRKGRRRLRSLAVIRTTKAFWVPGEKHFGLVRVPGRNWKNKRMFVMPMTRHTAKILKQRFGALGERPDAFLFGNEVGELIDEKKFWTLWDGTLVAAGLKTYGTTAEGDLTVLVDPDLHFHDLRAEFASQLLEAGYSLDRIRRLLDHSTLSMTQRYLRSRGLIFDDYGDGEESIAARILRRVGTQSATPLRVVQGGKS